jgi:hypothetical protein
MTQLCIFILSQAHYQMLKNDIGLAVYQSVGNLIILNNIVQVRQIMKWVSNIYKEKENFDEYLSTVQGKQR